MDGTLHKVVLFLLSPLSLIDVAVVMRLNLDSLVNSLLCCSPIHSPITTITLNPIGTIHSLEDLDGYDVLNCETVRTRRGKSYPSRGGSHGLTTRQPV